MTSVIKKDFEAMKSFISYFLILPEKLNVLHFYAKIDASENFEQALNHGKHFYFSNNLGETPLTIGIQSQSF